MRNNKKLKPFINIGPGYTIKEYLDARGWSQEDLAQLTDISTKQLSQIINNKVRITIDTARLFSKAFETSAEFWINLDTNYRLNLQPDTLKETSTQKKAQIRKYMPVNEILKKGWYNFNNTAEGYEALYKGIWKKSYKDISMYENPENKFCARQKKENEEFANFYSLTWQQVARQKATKIKVPQYKKEKLQSIINNYSNYTVIENGIKIIIKDLNKAGIKFFILTHLTKTYLDGACFYDNENPVIVYTGRYDRVDNFWFTLAHEIAHVKLHSNLLKKKCFLDDLKEGLATDNIEKNADIEAEKMLRADEIITEASLYKNYLSETRLNIISNKLKIEKSVILGVLQHKGIVEYRKLNKYKRKVIELFPKEINFG